MAHRHSHSHGNGHGGHDDHAGHDHSEDVEPALQSLLWKQIEFEKITTLNETEPTSGAQVVEKPWSLRLEAEPALTSDVDEELLMVIPFAGTVKLHSILIRSSESSSAPKTLHIYLNRNDLDFSAADDTKPTQTLVLSQTNEVQEIPVKRALFGNTYGLTLFFKESFGAESTEIFYIGFKGVFMALNRDPIEVLYERAANPKDHTPIVGLNDMAGSRTGM